MSVKFIFKDAGLNKLIKRMNALNAKKVHVGVFSNTDRGGIPMVELAAVHEFGSPKNNIPRRSFIADTFNNRGVKRAQAKAAAKVANLVINNKLSPVRGVELLGQLGVTQVKSAINNGIKPPLKPATVARKGHSKQLIDTGKLLNSIEAKVV